MSYLGPSEIAPLFGKSAVTKSSFTNSQLVIYAILGGAYIALGALLALLVTGGMPQVAAANPGIIKLIAGLLFPIGIVLVVLAGGELFTSDCAVIPFGVLENRISYTHIIRILLIVYVGNAIGAFLVAYFGAYFSGVLTAKPWSDTVIKLAIHKTEAPFWVCFVKGIFANWLVCLAVWLSYAAKNVSGKILGLWLPVMCFVALGMEHSIANLFYLPTALLLGAPLSIKTIFINNLFPATLGNMVGAFVLVTLPYWYLFGKKETKQTAFEKDNYQVTEKPTIVYINSNN